MNRQISTTATAVLLVAGLATTTFAQQAPMPAPAPDRTAVSPAPEPPQPLKGQMLQQPAGTMLSTDLVGASVKVGDQDKAGTVADLVITKDGKVSAVVLGVGGFLGLGSRNVAVNLEDVTIMHDGRKTIVQVNATKAQLEKAPPFKSLADIRAEQDAQAARQQRPTTAPSAPTPTR